MRILEIKSVLSPLSDHNGIEHDANTSALLQVCLQHGADLGFANGAHCSLSPWVLEEPSANILTLVSAALRSSFVNHLPLLIVLVTHTRKNQLQLLEIRCHDSDQPG